LTTEFAIIIFPFEIISASLVDAIFLDLSKCLRFSSQWDAHLKSFSSMVFSVDIMSFKLFIIETLAVWSIIMWWFFF
jgi:hypothetical protein